MEEERGGFRPAVGQYKLIFKIDVYHRSLHQPMSNVAGDRDPATANLVNSPEWRATIYILMNY